MKKIIATAISAFILGSAATATAAMNYWGTNNVKCARQGSTVACARTSGTGYGVGINRDAVMVMNLNTNRVVFQRYQP